MAACLFEAVNREEGVGGGLVLRVRSLEVARQRWERHVLLQGFHTSAHNYLVFMQVFLCHCNLKSSRH